MQNDVLNFYNIVAESELMDKIYFNCKEDIQYIILFEQKNASKIVGITSNGEWLLKTSLESLILKDNLSFFKLITLLELPFSKIEDEIHMKYRYLSYNYDVRTIFPFYQIVEYVFLNSMSIYWFELAYAWFEMLSANQKIGLSPILQKIMENKKLPQLLRQKITKALNSIERK